MDSIIVTGGAELRGQIPIAGAKNACLALMPATLLSEEPLTLTNAPRLSDIKTMAQLLQSFGAEVASLHDGQVLSLSSHDLTGVTADYDIVRKMRASNLVLGPLLAREGRAVVSLPGGCAIGARPMDLHIKGLQALGADLELEHGYIYGRVKQANGARVYLDFPSVGATENIMMMAAKTKGQSIIENAAKEPEIVDLANFLNFMGAKVRGAGTDIIKIEGVNELKPGRYAIIPDRIEAGTYMIAAAISGGEILVQNVIPTHLHPVIAKLQEAGAIVQETDQGILVKAGKEILPIDIKTLPYPGFPTDMQSQMMAFLSLANGSSMIVENVFENRFQIVDELKRMGARIKVEGHTAVIDGVSSLFGARVKATDLRAGAALILGGLAAEGETIIENAGYIFRGYENIKDKLNALGAKLI